MKIQYIKDDLFKTDIKHIVHGCNDKGVMGSGVALHIREKFPKAYDEYVLWHAKKGLNLGDIQFVNCGEKIIINAISQSGYGRTGQKFVSYDAIDTIFKKLDFHLSNADEKELAMPMIGAGLGGGNWDIIANIIETNMKQIQPIVYYL